MSQGRRASYAAANEGDEDPMAAAAAAAVASAKKVIEKPACLLSSVFRSSTVSFRIGRKQQRYAILQGNPSIRSHPKQTSRYAKHRCVIL